MIHIRPLHIAAAAALGDDAGMIATLDLYAPVSAKVVVDVHAAFGVVHRGDVTIRPLGNRAATLGRDRGAAFRGLSATCAERLSASGRGFSAAWSRALSAAGSRGLPATSGRGGVARRSGRMTGSGGGAVRRSRRTVRCGRGTGAFRRAGASACRFGRGSRTLGRSFGGRRLRFIRAKRRVSQKQQSQERNRVFSGKDVANFTYVH